MKRPRWIDKLVCLLIGHSTDPCDVYCCVCFRCGHEWDDYEKPPRSDLGFWLSYYNFKSRTSLGTLLNWLKCPYCKKRFGCQCDELMPF